MSWNHLHPKVAGASVGGSVMVVVAWLMAANGHPLPSDVTAALTTVLASALGYLVPGDVVPPTNTAT